MDERLNLASRWLLALAVILIPLTVIAMISGAWGLNYQLNANQWTRYLLFASWLLLALSAVAGTANLIAPPEAACEQEPLAPPREGDMEGDEAAGPWSAQGGRAFDGAYAFVLVQACAFVAGMIVYIAYLSWMLLGLQAFPSPAL